MECVVGTVETNNCSLFLRTNNCSLSQRTQTIEVVVVTIEITIEINNCSRFRRMYMAEAPPRTTNEHLDVGDLVVVVHHVLGSARPVNPNAVIASQLQSLEGNGAVAAGRHPINISQLDLGPEVDTEAISLTIGGRPGGCEINTTARQTSRASQHTATAINLIRRLHISLVVEGGYGAVGKPVRSCVGHGFVL